MSDWITSPVFDNLSLVIGLGIVAVAVALWGTLVTRTTPRRRWTLGGIRLLIILLTLLGLLRPTHVTREKKPQQSTIVLLMDRSKSMTVGDSLGGQSRWDALKKNIQEAVPLFRQLAETHEVKLYAFDTEVQSLPFDGKEITLGNPPDGLQTAIGASLRETIQREAGKQLAGVFLLSDGAQNSLAPRDLPPQTAARELASLGVPLYTIVFGQARSAGQSRDVAVTSLDEDHDVFVKNQWNANVQIRVDGFVNQDIPVRVEWETAPDSGKMEVVANSKIRPSQDGTLLPVDFTHFPQTDGEFKVTVRAAEMPGELIRVNNEMSTFVTVLKGGLNVLYLEGELRVEQRYLRRALDSSPNVHVDYVRIDHANPKNHGVDLSALFAKGKYDVIVLGDIDSAVFRKEDLASLRDRVKEGAGLLTLGGFHTYWPGGYGPTPLAEVLPIQTVPLDATMRQNFNDILRLEYHLPGPVKMRPAAPFGIQSPILQIGPAEKNAALWDALPPLDGANILSPLKASARVLAETADKAPLLVAQEVESGRVLAFAGDSTWKWYLKDHAGEHKRFWRQSIFWLARKSFDESVGIRLEQRRFMPGGRVEFTAAAKGADGEPLVDAAFTAEVLRPDGKKQAVALGRIGEKATGSFSDTSNVGDYTILVTATHNGAPLGQAKARFVVFEQDLELSNASARPDLLANLATLTSAAGGKALAPEQLNDALRELQAKPRQFQVEREEKETPWDKWPFLLTFIAFLSVDWFLRKRWGLV